MVLEWYVLYGGGSTGSMEIVLCLLVTYLPGKEMCFTFFLCLRYIKSETVRWIGG